MWYRDKNVIAQNGVVARGLCVWGNTYMWYRDKSVMVGMELEMEQNLLVQNANKKAQQIQLVAKKVVGTGKGGMACAIIGQCQPTGSPPGGWQCSP